MIASKALDNEAGEVSDWKVSTLELLLDLRMVDLVVSREADVRARRATAKLPWEGEERIRAMPVP